MSHAMPKEPVESKVKWATFAATAVGAVIAVLNWASADSDLLGSLPPWAQAVAAVAVPPLVTFLAGWKAKHTPRPNPTTPHI